jgi:catechol 2,3-dioxygenase-like lactoylglutathione lyase family enzyme
MIAGAHVLIYAEDADAARAFFRDVLGWENVEAHERWLIFALPPAELGVHPAGDEAPSGTHQLLLMCRDLEQTVADLRQRGAEFADEISDEGFGRLINLKVPGADVIGLYEPKHKSPLVEFG